VKAGREFRAGLVGAGGVSVHHLRALRALDRVRIVGIADADRDRAARVARLHRIPAAYGSLSELGAAAPDVVHILTPPPSHCALTLEALEMGCHVLVEKPMAMDAEECDRMIAKASETGRVLTVNHSARLDPVIGKALWHVKQGHLGDLLAVDFVRSSDYPPYAGGPLPVHYRYGGYPLRDLGVHGLSLIEAFLGPIRDVEVRRGSTGRDPNLLFDEWRVLVECDRGLGQMQLSWNIRPFRNELVVQGTAGVLHIDTLLQTCTLRRQRALPKAAQRMLDAAGQALGAPLAVAWNAVRLATGSLVSAPGIHESVRLFYEALSKGTPPPVSPEEGRRMVAWLDRAAGEADRDKARQVRVPEEGPAVLVTGATGFLGRALVRRLVGSGQRVRVLARRPSTDPLFDDPHVTVLQGDLGDPEAVERAVRGSSLVFHVGAATSGSWVDHQRGTVCGTQNIVESCLRWNVQRLIYVSSLSVLDYGALRNGVAADESAPLEPHPERRGHYAHSKVLAERVVLDAIRVGGLPAVVLRPAQILGRGANGAVYGVLRFGRHAAVVGDGTGRVPLVYVEDVVDALLLAAEREGICGSVFHLVDPEAVTQNEFLRLRRTREVLRLPRALLYAAASVLEAVGALVRRRVPLTRYRLHAIQDLAHFDCSRAAQVLGWRPGIGVRRGLLLTFGAPEPASTPAGRPEPSRA
jgi:predicted dehydrogenase/nucleoside-diphosphate-sugar epimerase